MGENGASSPNALVHKHGHIEVNSHMSDENSIELPMSRPETRDTTTASAASHSSRLHGLSIFVKVNHQPSNFLKRIPPTPVARLPFQECAYCAQVAFMSEKIRLLFPLGPELDGVGQGVDCLAMAANKGAAEIDVFEIMLLGL